MAPLAKLEGAESQTLLEAPASTHSYSATDGQAKTPPSARSSGVVIAALVVLAATAGVVASSAARRAAAAGFATKTALSRVPGGHYAHLSEGMMVEPHRATTLQLDVLYGQRGSITAHNEYTRQRGFAGEGYAHLGEGMVVEPYRVTTLEYVMPEGQTLDPDTQPEWTSAWTPNSVVQYSTEIINTDVQDADDGTTIITATTIFKDLGLHLTTLKVYLDDGSSYELSRSLYSHYVRRSIKRLTVDEKDHFFDAFLAMYRFNTSAGQHMFGGHFRGLRDFVGAHLAAAGTRNADRFHDGMGFVTQHAALTNEFELSMQSMYPSMAMPFWDYTEDGELVHDAKDLRVAWQQSLWSKDWFGNATGTKFQIEEGRFAYQEVYTSDKESAVTNPYGYMRSPWNMAKSPFVTRVHKFCDVSFSYQSWPFCADHYNMTFSSSYESWYDWVWAAGYVPHGPIHYYIGGYWNCGNLVEEFDKMGLSQAQVNDFAVWMIMLPKNYWRAYATESPKLCSIDTPQDECHMKCLLNYENKEDVNKFIEMMYSFIGNLGQSRAVSDANWLATLSHNQSKALMRLYCNTPFSAGEQIESASPMDVSFWPIHPTMERLVQYKRMANDFIDTEWSNSDDDTVYCTETGAYFAENYMDHGFNDDRITSQCLGHHAEDMTMFKSNILDTETGKYVYRATTNVELFKLINPAEYEASYIYENFEWAHCTDAYEFPSVEWGNVSTYSDTNTDDATHKSPEGRW